MIRPKYKQLYESCKNLNTLLEKEVEKYKKISKDYSIVLEYFGEIIFKKNINRKKIIIEKPEYTALYCYMDAQSRFTNKPWDRVLFKPYWLEINGVKVEVKGES